MWKEIRCENCGEVLFLGRSHLSPTMGLYRCVSLEERSKMGEFDDGFEDEGRTTVKPKKVDLSKVAKKPGYHLNEIKKGRIGEISKIQEELDELSDARAQGLRVMELVELSDLIGAVQAYMDENHPGYKVADLIQMAAVTKRAFENGHR